MQSASAALVIRDDSLPDYSIHLMRTLNERNFMVGIERSLIVGYVPAHRHDNFIVLDLACENARQLLDKVRSVGSLNMG